ncbi:MAG: hypothetical protein Q9169_008074, partial [Polycauliona sp. 2 TL-2023]
MDPISVAGLGLGAVSLAFQLFAGCIKGFLLLSTAHNFGKNSSTLLCMLNLQEIKLTEWARRAGLLSGHHTLDKRLNAVVVQAVLSQLNSLLLDTERLKARYKLALDPAPPSVSALNQSEDTSGGGILDVAISNETRRDIMFQAGLIQERHSFFKRMRWAAIDKTTFEEYVNQIRLFVQELWALLDPLRQDELAADIQMVLSHVIGTSRQIEGLYALKQTLQQSPATPDTFLPSQDDSTLANAAEIKAIGMSVPTPSSSARLPFTSQSDSSSGSAQDQSASYKARNMTAVCLESPKIQDFVPLQ